jgi:hypothetical protein
VGEPGLSQAVLGGWTGGTSLLAEREQPTVMLRPPRAPRLARIWCLSDDPAVVGVVSKVAFAFVRSRGRAEPLSEPVVMRVLLDAGSAAVNPITRVVPLNLDRTSEPVVFDVVPSESGTVPLTFRVYADRDSQLLMEVRGDLPVAEPVGDVGR